MSEIQLRLLSYKQVRDFCQVFIVILKIIYYRKYMAISEMQNESAKQPNLSQAFDQTLRIAEVFFQDVLRHVYNVETFKVSRIQTLKNRPAFTFKFKEEAQENIGFELFKKDFLKTKSKAQKALSVKPNGINFASVPGIHVFWKDFVKQHLQPSLIDRPHTLPHIARDKLESADLLKLKRLIYCDWEKCVDDINQYNNQDIEYLAKFHYDLNDLARSINKDYYAQCGIKIYDTNAVLHFH